MAQGTKIIRKKVEQWGGIEIGRLGFGAMRLPTGDDRQIDKAKAAALIHRAVEAGVNYFDSAYLYHGGESERFLGETLSDYPRESYCLATKLPPQMLESEEQFYTIFNTQIEKLRTDYLDFYLLHGLGPLRMEIVQKYGVIDKLVQLKKEGKVRRIGFSYHGDQKTLDMLIDMGIWDMAQIQFNYLDNDMINAKGLYDKLVSANVPCVCMEPVRGGFLASLPEEAQKLVEGFEGGAVTPAGWAFRWCIDRQGIAVVLSGMSTMEQVEENIETFSQEQPMTQAQTEMLALATKLITDVKAIPCTACRYCMECPSGVNIPEVFRIFNHLQLFKNGFRAGEDYKALIQSGNDVGKCVRCGECAPKCPQEIDIPERLAEVKEAMEKAMTAGPPRRR